MLDFSLNKFLSKYISLGDKLIIACSAGPDSMFLLYKLLESDFKDNLIVCYFNHKTRKETDIEEEFLRKLGEEKGFVFETTSFDFKEEIKKMPSISFEELARIKRYEFLNNIFKKYNSDYILTAHHLDDRIETFVFNLLRGTKLSGLINMTENSGNILRPLINLQKKDILEYLEKNNLKYFVDETNSDINITRNFLRHNVLKDLEKVNKNYKKNIYNLLSYFEDLRSYIENDVVEFLDNQRADNYFSITLFNKKPVFFQKELIRYIFFILNNNSTIGLSESNINEIIRFINGKNNKTKKEIKDLKLKKDGDKIYYQKKDYL